MRRRDLLRTLLALAGAPALLALGTTAGSAQEDAGPPAAPAADAPPEPEPAAQGPHRNNIVGLNVARLHQPLYIWATSDLVNANGGDWGYITVVWTIDDREGRNNELNLQVFLDRCFEFHVQPIVRVATKFEPKKGPGSQPPSPGMEGSWQRPDWDEPKKWREYFERARWPVSRVWIVAGNEPNLGREWGGEVDAAGYARYLAHFLDTFKDSSRFKVVNAPLDISNTTDLPRMQDALEFLDEMAETVPDLFERLPAWASNPYRVLSRGRSARFTHRAYEVELDRIGRELPVLITEAGHLDTGDEQEIARFYEEAFRDWMADPKVVAATPLFWHPDRNDYWMFELDQKGRFLHKSPTYELLRRIPRVAGSPYYVTELQNVARTEPYETLAAEEPAPGEPTDADMNALAGRPASDRPGDNWETEGRSASTTSRPVEAEAPADEPPAGQDAAGQDAAGQDPAARLPASQPSAGPGRPPAPEPATLRVTNTEGQGARLRAEPSRAAESIAVLPDGAVVAPVGPVRANAQADWRQVRTEDGAEGWVASDLLAPTVDED